MNILNFIFKYGIKKFVYFIKQHFLYFLVIFLIILLFNSKPVSAATMTDLPDTTFKDFKDYDENLINLIENTKEYKTGEYGYILARGDVSYYSIFLFKNKTNLKFYTYAVSGTTVKIKSNTTTDWIIYRSTEHPTSLSQKTTEKGTGYIDSWNFYYTHTNFTFYCTQNIYLNTNYNTLFYEYKSPQEPFIYPYIIEAFKLIENENIYIEPGSILNTNFINFEILDILNNNLVYSVQLNQHTNYYKLYGDTGGYYYEIPVNQFLSKLKANTEYLFILRGQSPYDDYSLPISVTYTGSDDLYLNSNQTIINQNSQIIQGQQQIVQGQQQIVQGQQDIKDSMTDSSLDSDIIDLPTDNNNDITQDGINNIFNIIYNGFCSGTPVDIVIPIPFTGKNFTIPANLTKNILSGTAFVFINTIIQTFWWYVISTFIVKDIAKKIDKIKSGNFENIETNNIKGDML